MAAELRLHALQPIPPLGFIYRRLTFDMTAILDADFKAQLAQILEAGFAAPFPALREEVAALEGEGSRSIRFFSDAEKMTSGSGTFPTEPDSSGSSSWRGPKGSMENVSPVASRSDLRVFVDQSGGSGVQVRMPDGSYLAPLWYLAGIVWHELHHLATTQQHTEPSSPYSGPWAVAMDRIKRGLPAQIWDPIAKREVSMNIPAWTVQNFTCGCGVMV